MKNFFKIIVLAAILCLIASCENSIGKKNLEPNDNDSTDSEMSDEDADSGDTSDADETDTTTDEDGNIPDETDDDTADTTGDDDNEDIVDTDSGEHGYNSPYGSISLSFENLIGTEEEPGSYNEIFAEGTYGNGTEEITPEYADQIRTMAFVHNDYIQIQQTLIYSDGLFENTTVFFYLPLEIAQNPGIYTLALNGDAAIILADVDWTIGQIQCYHAFGEGTLEISESNITDEFKVVSLSGNATLYHPLNYNGEDVSSTFLQTFTGTNMLCEPVD